MEAIAWGEEGILRGGFPEAGATAKATTGRHLLIKFRKEKNSKKSFVP